MLPIFVLLHKSVVAQPVICRIVSCHQIGNDISVNEDPAVVGKTLFKCRSIKSLCDFLNLILRTHTEAGPSHSNRTNVEAPVRANEKFIAVTPLEIKPRDLVPSSFSEIFKILTFSFRAKWHKEILHSIGQVAAIREEDERRSFTLF